MAVENNVQLLWNCATTLEPLSHTNKLLKSYYMTMCRKLANNALQIPKEKFSTSQMCSHCGCFWSESEFSLKLKPQQVAQRSKSKKLIEKLEKSNEIGQRGILNRKQKKRAKWIRKRIDNYIQIKCDQCKHKSLIQMEKTKIKQRKSEAKDLESLKIEATNDEVVPIETKSKKRKKKNKNKTAGLNIPLPTDNVTKLTLHSKNSSKAIPMPGQKQEPAMCNNHPKQSKKKQKLKCVKSSTSQVLSKTQQQNSLLQMAALLKQQASAVNGNGKSLAQKQLEALLK